MVPTHWQAKVVEGDPADPFEPPSIPRTRNNKTMGTPSRSIWRLNNTLSDQQAITAKIVRPWSSTIASSRKHNNANPTGPHDRQAACRYSFPGTTEARSASDAQAARAAGSDAGAGREADRASPPGALWPAAAVPAAWPNCSMVRDKRQLDAARELKLADRQATNRFR